MSGRRQLEIGVGRDPLGELPGDLDVMPDVAAQSLDAVVADAGKGHEVLIRAAATTNTREALLENPAVQIAEDSLLHERAPEPVARLEGLVQRGP